nr:putative mitochondrial protein [Tanacetum cinerariifolium]
MMREEMEKLMAEMRVGAMAATASGSGMVTRPQGEPQRGIQYHRVAKIEFSGFRGEDVRGWLFSEDCQHGILGLVNLTWEGSRGTWEWALIFDSFDILASLPDCCGKMPVDLAFDAYSKSCVRYCLKYAPGHKCSGQVYCLDVIVENTIGDQEECLDDPILRELGLELFREINLEGDEKQENKLTFPGLTPLLQEFKDVFAIPTSLPPTRSHDHEIPLKEGIQPVNIRPYRHPPTQKDAIEVMVTELLDAGVIMHS